MVMQIVSTVQMKRTVLLDNVSRQNSDALTVGVFHCLGSAILNLTAILGMKMNSSAKHHQTILVPIQPILNATQQTSNVYQEDGKYNFNYIHSKILR